MNDGTKTTFGELENGATFHSKHYHASGARNLTFTKTGPHRAQVTHDPRGMYVGVTYSFGEPQPVTAGPSSEFVAHKKTTQNLTDRERHEERKKKLEVDYQYWNDQYAKKPDILAGSMREANQNALYATKRILALLYTERRAELQETTTAQGG
jgi:hypothetical protein